MKNHVDTGDVGVFTFFLARGDVFKRVLLRKVFQFAKHSVSIGDQKRKPSCKGQRLD